MASVHLEDASFTVPIHKSHQKYFKFEWFLGFYKFIGMPIGYCKAMRKMTTILRLVFGNLILEGYLSVIFVDHSYLQGKIESKCLKNIGFTVSLLMKFGFKILEEKSILKSTHELEFLGFAINSKNMTISINKNKSGHTILKIKNLLIDLSPSIRKLASVIGYLLSSFRAISFGKLHYQNLEKEKTEFLKKSAWNFEARYAYALLQQMN